MTRATREFVLRSNVRRFRDLLAAVADDGTRQQLLELLAEEEAKLAAVEKARREGTPRSR